MIAHTVKQYEGDSNNFSREDEEEEEGKYTAKIIIIKMNTLEMNAETWKMTILSV